MPKFKILKQSSSCYLVLKTDTLIYKVYDIEGDVICMSKDREIAEESFSSYDINRVRKEKEEIFKEWLKENAEA